MVLMLYIATNQFGSHGKNIFRQVYSALLPDDGVASLAGVFAPFAIGSSCVFAEAHSFEAHRRDAAITAANVAANPA